MPLFVSYADSICKLHQSAGLEYSLFCQRGKMEYFYTPSCGIAASWSHGVTGYEIRFKPIDFGVRFHPVSIPLQDFSIGGTVGLEYLWQMYPDLHNAHLFAEMVIPLKLLLRYELRVRGHRFIADLSQSLVGLIGRCWETDPYVFSAECAVFYVFY